MHDDTKLKLILGLILLCGGGFLLRDVLVWIAWGVLGVVGIYTTLIFQRHLLHHDRIRAETETIRHSNHIATRGTELDELHLEHTHVRGMIDLQLQQQKHLLLEQKAYSKENPINVEEEAVVYIPDCDILDLIMTDRYRVGSAGSKLAMAVDESGDLIHVPLGNAGHIALAGSTGNGKTNALRWLLCQLVQVKAWSVYYISPAFATYKANGEDWSNIERLLRGEVARSAQDIEARLLWAVSALQARMDAEALGDTSWSSERIYIAIDEYKEVVDRYPEAPTLIGNLLRMGRQYEIFVILSSQDFLIKNIGGDSGARDSYGTIFYFGGDPTTCRSLLGKRVDESSLVEAGYAYVKGRGHTQGGVLARLPYASNEGIAFLLDHKDSVPKHTPPAFQKEARDNMEQVQSGVDAASFYNKYMFTEEQRAAFIEAYSEFKAIKPALRAMGVGNGYFQAAKAVLAEQQRS